MKYYSPMREYKVVFQVSGILTLALEVAGRSESQALANARRTVYNERISTSGPGRACKWELYVRGLHENLELDYIEDVTGVDPHVGYVLWVEHDEGTKDTYRATHIEMTHEEAGGQLTFASGDLVSDCEAAMHAVEEQCGADVWAEVFWDDAIYHYLQIEQQYHYREDNGCKTITHWGTTAPFAVAQA